MFLYARICYLKSVKYSTLSDSCDEALGAASGGALPESSFSASSSISFFLRPARGRLNGETAWCSSGSPNGNDFLQVDLGTVSQVCAVATQGHNSAFQLITSYQLQYSLDGISWSTVMEDGKNKVAVIFFLSCLP